MPAPTRNPSSCDPTAWPERRFYAMGCHMSARLAIGPARAAAPLAQVEALFADAEKRLSRFDPNSELSRLNACPGRWQPVSRLLWDVLASALLMAEETGGLFDPTLLPALEAAGYTRSFEQLRDQRMADEPAAAGPMGDGALPGLPADPSPPLAPWPGGQYRLIRRRPMTHKSPPQVRLPAGVKLDFGGIAKGYVAQQAVMLLRRFGPALVDAGGDLAAGDAPPGFPGWPVAVAAPDSADEGEGRDLALVWLANAALATSGTDYRRWQWNGRAVHHILDPRSGQPAATDLVAVTVLAPTAVQAEAWAKAALILGQQTGAGALAARRLAGLLAGRDGRVTITPALRPWLAWPALHDLNSTDETDEER
ncbi:MAG TPA: FAD:protein FMN transferase [Caldilineaceae bacterium]|nr:FAD:protein FMN transferase [Caldilineaceae bacterium]